MGKRIYKLTRKQWLEKYKNILSFPDDQERYFKIINDLFEKK